MNAAVKREKRQRDLGRAFIYNLGQLVAIGVNNPKKFPKPEKFMQEKSKRVVTDLEERRAIMRAFVKRFENGS